MDLIDLFIGSEGTLGIITELELKLLKLPEAIWGIVFFFCCEENALTFVDNIRKVSSPDAIEFFNYNALSMFRKYKQISAAARFQNLPEVYHTAVYTEFHGQSYNEVYEIALKASDIYEKCGEDSDNTWVAANKRDMESLHTFRHSIPETVNNIIDQRRKQNPGLTKLGTDMAVPDSELFNMMKTYNADLLESGLESVIFGHIGNNHVHVNILPYNMEDYAKGKELYQKWAEKVIGLGGTISAEHGVGKLKTAFLAQMYGQKSIKEMKALKKCFDPSEIFNRGNLFVQEQSLPIKP
jgi:D-lactate dehydrogenase (cytochrome)